MEVCPFFPAPWLPQAGVEGESQQPGFGGGGSHSTLGFVSLRALWVLREAPILPVVEFSP